MRNRPLPHPLRSVFEARREYDDARVALYRMLAVWAAGEAEYDAMESSLGAFQRLHVALLESIEAHRSTMVDTGPAHRSARVLGVLRNFLPEGEQA